MAIWPNLWSFGIYFYVCIFMVIWYILPVLVYCTKKNLATLSMAQRQQQHLNCHVLIPIPFAFT
jgi:hypothetical protein